MTSHTAYTTKAQKYARCRWDYAPAAIEFLFEQTRLTPAARAADLGAGTGMLTRHLSARARAYAIEPDAAMCALARQTGCQVIQARAEALPLPPASVDLFTAAHALHWFEAGPARAEMRRAARPGCWLALLRNYGTDADLNRALGALYAPELGANLAYAPDRPPQRPLEFFFDEAVYRKAVFPFTLEEDWERFIGSLLSAAFMPDEDHPLYPRLEEAARKVFEDFSRDGRLELRGETELVWGRV